MKKLLDRLAVIVLILFGIGLLVAILFSFRSSSGSWGMAVLYLLAFVAAWLLFGWAIGRLIKRDAERECEKALKEGEQ